MSDAKRKAKSITRQKTVLIVDDDTGTLLLNNGILKNDGYAVAAATSGVEALKTLGSVLVDIAVLDIQMPDMSGLELYGKMQADKKFSTIPVIFVTSDSEKDTVLKAAGMGAVGYVVKPVDKASLLHKVRWALEKSSVDQGVLYLSRKIGAIVTVLRQIKALNAQMQDILKSTDVAVEEHSRCEKDLQQNWGRVDAIIGEIPQEFFTPIFELMLKRLRPGIAARDANAAATAGNLILEELDRHE
jgi:CheY-like chemotaxis protein